MSLWDAFRNWAATPAPEPVKQAGFVPQFEDHYVINAEMQRIGDPRAKVVLSPYMFATEATAREMLRRFSAVRIEIRQHAGGSPIGTDALPTNPLERWLVFADGLTMNAGKVAEHWVRFPEAEHGAAAEREAWRTINAVRENWIQNYGAPQ